MFCLITIIWWSIGTSVSTQRASALAAAARDTTNLARAFEENTQRIISSADQVLLSLRSAYQRDGKSFALNEWVRRESAPDWLMAQIAIIAPDGMSVASTASTRSVSVADRRHFIVQRDSSADELFISAPVLGRSSGRWTVQLTRRMQAPDGGFDGVVVLSLDCYQLSGFYESLNLQQGFLELVGLDGLIRARGPVVDGAIGSSLALEPDRVLQENSGLLRIHRQRDALTVAFRRLAAYPLVVLVAFDDKAVLAGQRHTRRVMIISGAVSTLVLLVIGAVWIRQRKRSIRFQESLELTLESMSQGLVMIDRSRNVQVVNRRALELLGQPVSLLPVINAGNNNERHVAGRRLLADLDRHRDTRDHGEELAHPVLEFSNSPTATGGSVQTITDVTARHLADRRIRYMALHDHLTGLGNRVLFADEADHLLASASRDGGAFDVLCLDLNGFKKVNDTLGHDIGDSLLIQVGERLRQAVGSDLVARTGGDEFAILTGMYGDPARGEAVAQEVLEQLERPFAIAEQQVRIGASIGIARYPDDGSNRADLLRNADLALYVAKTDRKHPVRRFAASMADGARLKQQLEEDLRAAIGSDQFFLEFQPQFRTSSLAVVGFEALVRWQHPSRGRLGPDAFIPVAEETGLIVALGRWVLEEACRVALHWPESVHIAVNLSPVQFRDPNIVGNVAAILAATGLPASRLELEVTEGVLIADEQQALATLNKLRELGVTLALDDFGTGYASLSYLRQFPFEQIKLDRSFVQAQVVEERSRHILRAILSLSRSLKLSVVAEGVETRTQLHLLRQQGCHAVQGFLVGRPMSRRDAETMFPPDIPILALSPQSHNLTPMSS